VSVHQGIRKAFSELRQETEKLAAGFLALGLEKGDRIGIWGPNTYEWYITQLAAGKAGLVLVSPKLFGGPIHTLIWVEIQEGGSATGGGWGGALGVKKKNACFLPGFGPFVSLTKQAKILKKVGKKCQNAQNQVQIALCCVCVCVCV
jgi:hypothetical protein